MKAGSEEAEDVVGDPETPETSVCPWTGEMGVLSGSTFVGKASRPLSEFFELEEGDTLVVMVQYVFMDFGNDGEMESNNPVLAGGELSMDDL